MSEFHSTDFPAIELPLCIITIAVFVILAVVMLCMMMHLAHKTYKECMKKKNANKENKISIFFLLVTLVGLLSFEASLLMTILLVIEIFLLDDVIKSRMISSQFFFQIYPLFEYSIGTLDALGHLLMLFVFIARFQYSFKNEIFHQSKWFIRSMYIILTILSLIAMFIIVYFIPSETNANQLFALEIAWEMCVESMIVFILFMFVSNLYKLLKFSLWNHLKDGNPQQFISEITKISLESSASKKSNNTAPVMLTIDGCVVDPNELTTSNKSIKLSTEEDAASNTATPQPQPVPNYIGYSQSFEVLTVMTKITVLVIIAATTSYVSIIGNFIIETSGVYNEKNIGGTQGIDHDAIYVFILPVFDMVITATMMYLQFNFTHKVYKVMCNCADILVLRCMLSMVTYHWKTEDDPKRIPLELETKSTAISDVTNLSNSVPSQDVHIQMEVN